MLHLHTIWFVIIAVLWVGFFVLEGFDFGVGMLHTFVGETETERARAINTIGPWWDGNEVWLVVAGAGTFAAFPGWYATMFSALYLPLLIVLVALMARGVALRVHGKREDRRAGGGTGVVHDARQPAHPAAARHRARRSAARPADRLQPRVHRQLLRPAHPYGVWTGLTLRRPVPAARRDLPEAADDRPGARARAALARPLGWAAIALVVGFVDLDADGRRRTRRARPGRGARADRGGVRGAAGDRPTTTAWPSPRRRSRSPRRRLDLHRPVSERDGLQHQRRVQPDSEQLGLGRLCAEGDDDRRA